MPNSVTQRSLHVYGTTWLCESTFSTVPFLTSKSRLSISDENLASDWRCKIYIGFLRLSTKKKNIKSHQQFLPLTLY